MSTAVMLFTRDLRVHDNPALQAACTSAARVVPLFVFDPSVPTSPGRQRFLIESLEDLRTSLRQRGGDLVVRHGDPVSETIAAARSAGASSIMLSADASAYAARRQRRLAEAAAAHRIAVTPHDGVTVVPPGVLRPATGSSQYRVFTPYWRAWCDYPFRAQLPAPRRVPIPDDIPRGAWPAVPGRRGDGFPGGESTARRRLDAWVGEAFRYTEARDMLSADATSRLSPYLHFGCVSPLSVLAATGAAPEAFARQLCWRDFYHQTLAAFPALGSESYRPHVREDWRDDADALAAWQEGRTGVPIVDAGMRQLAAEGFMHNRARLITASFLTSRLRIDWRRGAHWYARSLLDADVANKLRQLAVGGRHRYRHQAVPALQPAPAGAAVRPSWRLRPALGSRTGRHPRPRGP
jgi:deoxyribodipyrimidine photo-lyase